MTEVVHKSAEVKRSDARSYDAKAAEFASLTEVYSARVAERMLDLVGIQPDQRILDVGTGSGLLARMAAARGAHAVGIDHSAGMLEQAQLSADAAGVGGRTQFQAMDAEALDFGDRSFDATVSLYVLRHLPNPAIAVGEMYRTMRPGGRLAIAVGARPDPLSVSGLAATVGAVSDRIHAALGRRRLTPGSLRDFLGRQQVAMPHDHAAHSQLGNIRDLLRSVGFRDVRQEWLGERHILSPEDFWNVQAVFDGDARGALTALDEGAQEALKRRYLDSCAEQVARGRQLVHRIGALILHASR